MSHDTGTAQKHTDARHLIQTSTNKCLTFTQAQLLLYVYINSNRPPFRKYGIKKYKWLTKRKKSSKAEQLQQQVLSSVHVYLPVRPYRCLHILKSGFLWSLSSCSDHRCARVQSCCGSEHLRFDSGLFCILPTGPKVNRHNACGTWPRLIFFIAIYKK